MLSRYVLLFGHVTLLVEKLHGCIWAAGSNSLPTPLIKRGLLETAFLKFPLKEFVGLLRGRVTGQRGHEANRISIRGKFSSG